LVALLTSEWRGKWDAMMGKVLALIENLQVMSGPLCILAGSTLTLSDLIERMQRARDDCVRVDALLSSAQRLLDVERGLVHTPQQQQAATTAATAAVATGETTTEALANLVRADSDAREAAALLRDMCTNHTDLVRAEGVRLTPVLQGIAERVTARLAYRTTLALVTYLCRWPPATGVRVTKLLVYEVLRLLFDPT
jgi:hypothetical protein